MVYSDNLRPEEKLEHQTEQTQYENQLPLTRSEPYPHLLARSFDALEQVMSEQQATQHCREFVALRSIFPDRDVFFSRRARRDEGQPNEADHIYRMLWPNTVHNGSRTRHQDQCPSKVSFRTADPRQSIPAR